MRPELGARLAKAQQIIQSLELELREADRGLIALTEELEARAAALEESESRFRLMVEGSEEVFFFTHNAAGLFTYLSPSIERVLGYDPAELLGEPYQALLTGCPQNRGVLEKTAEAVETGERGETYTAIVRHRTGREICLEIAEHPVTRPDGAVEVQGFARDVTEQRRRQDALRETTRLMDAMITASPAAIYVLDGEGKVELWNPAAEKLFGWSAIEVLGEPLPPGPGEPEDELGTLMERSLGGHAFSAIDVRRLRKDGRAVSINVSTAPLRDRHGQIEGIVVVVVDVSEKRQLQEQLLQAQKMDAIGRLAGGVAHDFNNILTAVTGHAQFALDQLAVDSPVREEIEEVQRSAERAALLTRQLLAFSRQQLVRPRVVDVAVIVREMERMLRRIIGDDIEMSARVSEGRVVVDPGQLQQVLLNLVVNARDAMPGGGRIDVEVGPLEEQVRIAVGDTGHGMDAETRRRLFEPFFTTKALGKGTGLGLATVYGIVTNLDGEVRVESAPGQGSTFEVLLPRTDRPVDTDPALPESDSPAPAEESATVLVVEDEPTVRKLVSRTLARQGYHVMEAAGPPEALALSDENLGDVALVVSDVVMPGMSGDQLVAALRERCPDLAVMFMSGYTKDEVLRQGVADMDVHFIEKPFSPRELARKVEAALRSR